MLVRCEYCGHRWDSDGRPVRGRLSCRCGNNTRLDEAIRVWRGRLGRSWDRAYGTLCRFWREVLSRHPTFKDMTPSQLVEWQVNAKGRMRFYPLSLAQDWVNGLPLRYGSKVVMLSHIRSFYLHNHAELPMDRSFSFHADIPSVDGKLKVKDYRRVLLNSNKMYRAVFLMMGHGLMGEGELVYVNVEHCDLVLEKLTKNVGVFKIPLPGRKRSRNKKSFYTMLNTKSDWGDAMRDYLKSLPQLPSGALFHNQKDAPLTEYNIHYYFHQRAVEAGVIEQFTPNCTKCGHKTVRFHRGPKIGYRCRECPNVDWASDFDTRFTNVRYGVNPHEIRDLMSSRWHVSGADDDVADFMMEHEIDPNKYRKFMDLEPWYPVEEYRKAQAWLNVLSQDPEKVSRFEVQSQLDASEAKVEVLSREIAGLQKKLKLLDDPELLEALKEFRSANKKSVC